MNEKRAHISPFIAEKSKTAVEAVESLLAYAAGRHAFDIHIDPIASGIRVRMRIDGIMEEIALLPRKLHEELIARLKILAGVRTDVHSTPQDGRWKADMAGQTYSARISFMPTYHGENAVIRLLQNKISQGVSFEELGFAVEHVDMIYRALERTSGLILVSGPTGSGKTTTLHSCVSVKSKEPLSVMTLEDPVEYEISGVRQVHIRTSGGVTFASGLRAAVRQDPDVIMIGEIRDTDTAHIAVHTALTGHLVLSTVHTTSALESVTRLLDMGVDKYVLAPTLALLISQRLARMICAGCNDQDADRPSCDACAGKGYSGRTVIAEAFAPDKGFCELLSGNAPPKAYAEYIQNTGFKSMKDHGLEKVEWGITTRVEVVRVLTL